MIKRLPIISVITFCIALFVLNSCAQKTINPNSGKCAQYTLNEHTAISDKAKIPSGSWNNMKSPHDGSVLEKIILDPDDPNAYDEPWRFAYYSEKGNIFWIVDMPGFRLTWYGPFEGKPCIDKK